MKGVVEGGVDVGLRGGEVRALASFRLNPVDGLLPTHLKNLLHSKGEPKTGNTEYRMMYSDIRACNVIARET